MVVPCLSLFVRTFAVALDIAIPSHPPLGPVGVLELVELGLEKSSDARYRSSER